MRFSALREPQTAVPLDTSVKPLIESLAGNLEKDAKWKLVINKPVAIDP